MSYYGKQVMHCRISLNRSGKPARDVGKNWGEMLLKFPHQLSASRVVLNRVEEHGLHESLQEGN